MSDWFDGVTKRAKEDRCVVCGSSKSVTYNGFPLCKSDDGVLTRRINKAENYAKTVHESGMSVARELCIDSSTPEEAASFIIVEYGGYMGLQNMVGRQEMCYLDRNFPEIMDYIEGIGTAKEQKRMFINIQKQRRN